MISLVQAHPEANKRVEAMVLFKRHAGWRNNLAGDTRDGSAISRGRSGRGGVTGEVFRGPHDCLGRS